LSLRINAIVDDHIAVAVALVFAKLSIAGAAGGQQVALFLPELHLEICALFTGIGIWNYF
jgi:hypothetical protein